MGEDVGGGRWWDRERQCNAGQRIRNTGGLLFRPTLYGVKLPDKIFTLLVNT